MQRVRGGASGKGSSTAREDISRFFVCVRFFFVFVPPLCLRLAVRFHSRAHICSGRAALCTPGPKIDDKCVPSNASRRTFADISARARAARRAAWRITGARGGAGAAGGDRQNGGRLGRRQRALPRVSDTWAATSGSSAARASGICLRRCDRATARAGRAPRSEQRVRKNISRPPFRGAAAASGVASGEARAAPLGGPGAARTSGQQRGGAA